ncbi:hypothetical protein MFIFM68171_04755 [Madurella fahalii]|uniref:Uncharacterized protein n=1 Tax=Madurella fahalii TaxID=1157608 RepID=A0ABQ0GA19_9PEZI
MLGDIYADNGKLQDAIQVYECVILEYDRMGHVKLDEPLRPVRAQYSLGSIYARVGRERDAEALFHKILARCDLRKKTEDMKKAEKSEINKTGGGDGAKPKASPSTEKNWNPPEDIEAFKGLWSSRNGQAFKRKNERDNQAAIVYQRALKRFDTMFRKDHVLCSITALHLGINYMLRSKYSEAEPHLMRALTGFYERLIPLLRRGETALQHRSMDEHTIVVLTRYYLGQLFIQQQKLNEAEHQLDHVRAFAAPGPDQWESDRDVLQLSVTCALGQISLTDRKADYAKAQEYFASVLKRCGSEPEGDLIRLAFQANLGLAKAYHGRKKTAKASSLCRKTLEKIILAKGSNPHDLDECKTRLFLGTVYQDQNQIHQLSAAKEEIEKAFRGLRFLEGERSLEYLQAARKLGIIYGLVGKNAEAEGILVDALESLNVAVGAYHPYTLRTSWQLGRLYLAQRQLDGAMKACERAYQGFEKRASGAERRQMAETAQTLGTVYLEKGMLGKAKEMYLKAFETFKAAASKTTGKTTATTKSTEQGVTDKATLLAAMDLAKVCALLWDPKNRAEAMRKYQLAENGFRSTSQTESFHLLDAQLSLGSIYRKDRQFSNARANIQSALDGFNRLHQSSGQTTEKNEAKAKCAAAKYFEAKLRLGQLKLDEYKGEKGGGSETYNQNCGFVDSGDEESAENLVAEARAGLMALLGENDMLTLEASTILGELYLDMGEDAGEEDLCEKGETILRDVLECYDAEVKVSPGHPKKIWIMNRLIECFDKSDSDRQDEVDQMKDRKWRELVKGYGEDIAAMVMDVTDLKHTKRYRFDDDGGSEDLDGDDSEDQDDDISDDQEDWDDDYDLDT